MLVKKGYSIRVDHRTLEAQQEETEQNGDSFLAKLNLRVPEEYIGMQRAHSNSPFVEVLKKKRAKTKI